MYHSRAALPIVSRFSRKAAWWRPAPRPICRTISCIVTWPFSPHGLESSAPGLDPRPQPVDQPLRLLVVRGDGVELRHRGGIGIDGTVVEDRLVDEFLARQ